MAEEGISPQSEETETIDTITLNELEANEQIQGTDLILTRDEQGRDRKATMQQVKDFSYPPAGSATQAGLINTEDQTFTGVKTFEDGIEAGNITKNGDNVLTQPETEQLIQVTKSELEEMIAQAVEDAMYCKPGQIERTTLGATCPGFITGSGTNLTFSIPLIKSLKKVGVLSKSQITKLKMVIRGATLNKMGYVGVTVAESTSGDVVDRVSQITQVNNNTSEVYSLLRIVLTAPNGGKWYVNGDNTGNNFPVVLNINDLEISF